MMAMPDAFPCHTLTSPTRLLVPYLVCPLLLSPRPPPLSSLHPNTILGPWSSGQPSAVIRGQSEQLFPKEALLLPCYSLATTSLPTYSLPSPSFPNLPSLTPPHSTRQSCDSLCYALATFCASLSRTSYTSTCIAYATNPSSHYLSTSSPHPLSPKLLPIPPPLNPLAHRPDPLRLFTLLRVQPQQPLHDPIIQPQVLLHIS